MKNANQRKKIVEIIVKIIITLIIIPIFIITIIVIVKSNKYPDKIPDIFGYKPMIVVTDSMETTISPGDLVFVKIVNPDSLKINDIIAFRNEKNTVTTHRIIEITNEKGQRVLKTKGDNNTVEDFVSEEKVEGIYVAKIPKIGNCLMFLKEPKSLIIILLIILIVGLIWIYLIDKKESEEFIK